MSNKELKELMSIICEGQDSEQRRKVENFIEYQVQLIDSLDKEIDRLNNIINELEKWLKERYDICKKNIDKMEYNEYSHNFYQVANNVNADRKDTLNKLQELKGSDKE